MPEIKVEAICVEAERIVIDYRTSDSRTYKAEIVFRRNIKESLDTLPAEKLYRLLNLVSLTLLVYFYNFDYFNEVTSLYPLSGEEKNLLEDFYFSGLAEFRITNNIPLTVRTTVKSGNTALPQNAVADMPQLSGFLITNGGGKDGAVAVEAIASTIQDEPLEWFTIEKKGSRISLIEKSPLHQDLEADRIFHPDIESGPYKGHKPFSGSLACISTLAALIRRRRYVVVANELSANEGNLVVEGIEVNHQYTKSFEFEKSIQSVLANFGVYYFSAVRPLYELQILGILRHYPKYHGVFVSCNKGVRRGEWCLSCSKCAFVVLCVTGIDPEMAASIWGNPLAIAIPELQNDILALISPDIDKPFECVGTLDECQLAAGMIVRNQNLYNQLPPKLQGSLRMFSPGNFEAMYASVFMTVDRAENFPQELRKKLLDFYRRSLELS